MIYLKMRAWYSCLTQFLKGGDQLDEFLQNPDGGDTTIVGANQVLSEDTMRQSEDRNL